MPSRLLLRNPLEPSSAACVGPISSGNSSAALAPSITAASTQFLIGFGVRGGYRSRAKKNSILLAAGIVLILLIAQHEVPVAKPQILYSGMVVEQVRC
ncbi:hypothetical protein EDB85DRAFT_1946979 [Lactarius pseudohatsudake]|nr:hypothetical protein EDB85DRAFT_1946979 [Lactarius pseudohatsudake]